MTLASLWAALVLPVGADVSPAMRAVIDRPFASGPLEDAPLPTPRRTVPVSDREELLAALSEARAGDRILVADGTYTGDFTVAAIGTETDPVVVMPADGLHGPVFTGSMILSGKWIVIYALKFDGGTRAADIYGEDIRVTRCHFINTRHTAVRLQETARRPVVSYNLIEDFGALAGSTIARGIGSEHRNGDYVREPRVFRNHLRNQLTQNGGGIIFGRGNVDSYDEVNGIVEYNLVEDFNAIEPISAKSSGNTFRYNTLMNADGVIMCRFGSNNDFIGNSSINSGGVALMGKGNRSIGNYHDGERGGNWLSQGAFRGSATHDTVTSVESGSAYPRCENSLFSGNTGPMNFAMGTARATNPLWSLPAANNRIEAHTGPFDAGDSIGTSGSVDAPASVEVPPPVILTYFDVGPFAHLKDSGFTVTESFRAAANASIYEVAATASGGGDLYSGRLPEPDGRTRRALVRFDLSGLPPNAKIADVTLRTALFSRFAASGDGLIHAKLHRVLQRWSEGDTRGTATDGAEAMPGSCTWYHRDYPDHAWIRHGGDFAEEPSATLTISPDMTPPRSIEWQGGLLVAEVQRWVAYPDENHGWIILVDEAAAENSIGIRGRNARSAEAHPTLLIEYGLQDLPAYGPWEAVNLRGDASDAGLGWINILHAPWIYIHAWNRWLYHPGDDGRWFFWVGT